MLISLERVPITHKYKKKKNYKTISIKNNKRKINQ